MSVIHLNKENFEEEVNKSEIPVLIDFWAPWCGPCQMMGPVFESLSEEFSNKVKFAKLDTEENPEIAGKYSISSIPCLVFIKNGNEVDRFIGFMDKDQLKSKIEETLNKI